MAATSFAGWHLSAMMSSASAMLLHSLFVSWRRVMTVLVLFGRTCLFWPVGVDDVVVVSLLNLMVMLEFAT